MRFDKFTPCHVIIRSVEGRSIFSSPEDCSRFVYQIYAVNIGKPAFNIYRKDIVYIADKLLSGEKIPWKIINSETYPIVDILSFVLVDNHAHFILSPNIEKGISKYIHKLSLSFAKYYNAKHDREGVLFNKPYKIVQLETSSQLDDVMRYINVKNSLDIYNSKWKDGVEDWKEAFDFISNYKYSSYPDLFGKRSSKILASESILAKYLGHELDKRKVENIDFIEKYFNKEMDYNHSIFLEERC